MNRLNVVLQVAALATSVAAGPVMGFEPFEPFEPWGPEQQARVLIAGVGGGSYLGVGVAEISAERVKALNLREERGVEITRVEEGSPAEKGGLKTGDVVLEFNGERVEGLEQFMRMVRETPPGREVKLGITRSGSAQQVVVKTGSRKSMLAGREGEWPKIVMPEIRIPDVPRAYMSWRSTTLGVDAESLDSQLAAYFGVKEGVLVRSVIKGSAADKAGLKAGDVITKVDDTAVSNPREITSAIRSARSKSSVVVAVVRDKKEMTFTVTLDNPGSNMPPAGPAQRISQH
jgi:serine protease Do